MKSLGQEYLGDQTARWRLGEHPCAFRRALCSALTGWPATWAAWYDFAVAQRKTIRSPRRDAIYGLQFRPIVKIKEFAMPETLPFICMLTISILSNLITYLILTTSACISHSPSDSEWKYGRLVVITAGVLFAAARREDCGCCSSSALRWRPARPPLIRGVPCSCSAVCSGASRSHQYEANANPKAKVSSAIIQNA
jgi:hypothetical protein